MVVKSILRCAFKGVSINAPSGVPLLSDVDYEFPMGEVVQIDGAHGAGKSMLLKLVSGLIRPNRGSVIFNNDNVTEMNFSRFLAYRRNIGYANGAVGLLSAATIEENLALPLDYHPLLKGGTASDRVEELIEEFKLGPVRHLRPGHVSDSYRRIAVFARSVIFRPQMLALDSPTTDLSDEDRQRIADYIQRERSVRRLRHVFLVSRDQLILSELATKHLMIDNRSLSEAPAPGEIQNVS